MITQRTPATVTVPVGKILTITAAANSRGMVFVLPISVFGKRQLIKWVEANSTVQIGPDKDTRTYRIEAITGELDHEVKDNLIAHLEQQVERIKSATIIAKALNEGRKAMTDNIDSALAKVDAAATPAKRPAAPGSFAAGIRAMMDEARAGIVQAREEGLGKVQDAVAKLGEAKAATAQVARHMAKTIEDEAADVMAELGQLSNMPPEEI